MALPYEDFLELLDVEPETSQPVAPPILPTTEDRPSWELEPPAPYVPPAEIQVTQPISESQTLPITVPSYPTTTSYGGEEYGYQPYEFDTSGQIPAHEAGGYYFQPSQGGGGGGQSQSQFGRPEDVIPDYRYEYEGIEPTRDPYGRPVDLPGPGPTEAAPPGKQWAVRYYESPTGGGTWGWTLVDEGESSRAAVPGTSSGGGSGGGGGGGGGGRGTTPASEQPLVEPLGELAWWGPDEVPPLLRSWATWLRELVEINALTSPVPNPFTYDEEAEAAAIIATGKKGKVKVQEGETLQDIAAQYGLTLEQLLAANPGLDPNSVVPGQKIVVPNKKGYKEGAEPPVPEVGETPAIRRAGYRTTPEILEQLQGMLGVEYEPGEDATSRWQKFINAIPRASLEAQQLLTSLRFDPKRGWYTTSTRQLVNPKYT